MEYEEEQEEIPSYNDDESLPNSTRPSSPKLNNSPLLRKCRYKECLKNHAVGIGGHAVDGCGEFIAAGEDGSLESLRCAACSCHRNFHRKEPDAAAAAAFLPFPHHYHHHHGHFGYRGAPPGVGGGYLHMSAGLLALPSSSGGREEAEEYNYYCNPSSGSHSQKKRFRTKFSQEQKEKMLSLAERLGWKIQRQDEELVQNFCNEVGIKRHVLKVWMHNNKHTLGKKT